MSKLEEGLVDKFVALYLDGGWEVTGRVKKVTESSIVIQQPEDSELSLIFREKISCLRMLSEPRAYSDAPNSTENSYPTTKNNVDDSFPMNRMAYDESGMTIPRGLLEDLPVEEDDDLSVSFGNSSTGLENGHNGVEFRIDDDSKKKD